MKTLLDWFVHHIKQKDLHFNHIKEVKILDDSSFFIFKIKKQEEFHEFGFVNNYLLDFVNFSIVEDKFKFEKDKDTLLEFSYIVFFSSKNALEFIELNWPSLIKYRKLKVYFVNPNSIQKTWAFSPYSHDFIQGTMKSLKQSLVELGFVKNGGSKIPDLEKHL